jgi:hypothetical protein
MLTQISIVGLLAVLLAAPLAISIVEFIVIQITRIKQRSSLSEGAG